MKYRKKPVEVEAFKFGTDPIPQWFLDKIIDKGVYIGFDCPDEPYYAIIRTLEGPYHASYGDYIIKGIQGELYPCKPDILREITEEECYAHQKIRQ